MSEEGQSVLFVVTEAELGHRGGAVPESPGLMLSAFPSMRCA